MITIQQYFRDKPRSIEQVSDAGDMLARVNSLLASAALGHAYLSPLDPDTMSQISGSKGGTGDGGFRLPESTTGAVKSSHKEARGIDVFDPHGKLDDWITDAILEKFDLYREHPKHTPGWCHLTTRPPGSHRRTFTLF